MTLTGEDTRNRIVHVSAEAFARNGYHATGLTQLLDEIGLGKGGFYHYFRSKEQVLLEIMTSAIHHVLESSGRIVAQQVDTETKLRLLCDDLSAAVSADLASWMIFLREYSSLSQGAQKDVLGLRAEYVQRWQHVIEEGIERGAFAAHHMLYAEGILGLWIYSFFWNKDRAAPEQIAADMAALMLDGVRRRDGSGPRSARAGQRDRAGVPGEQQAGR